MEVGISLRHQLQAAVHGLNWTYAAFWTLHPTLQVLVWDDGFYNGPIKTYKTVGDSKLSAKEFGFQRSQQLHDLYTRLNAGEGTSHSPQHQSSALNPEDLTEAEWFYVVCMSSLFASGAGLPGRAFANARYVWHCGSGDARVFIRALHAKTAGIQTVVCIPLLDGVLEFGSTDVITEDPELLQRMQSFFGDQSKPSISNFESSAVFSKDRIENYKKVMEEGTRHGAFKEWRPTLLQRPANSQKMLKTALFTVTHLYTREDNQGDISRMGRASTMFEGLDPRMNRGFRKPWEVGGSHVMAERRRREKLNDRFVSLRAIVPFVTKADKASILGDTIEYVKELQRRVQELETQNTEIKGRQDSGSQKEKDVGDRQQLDTIHITGQETTVPGGVESGRSLSEGAVVEVTVDQDMSTVRIHCRWRRSLLIDILHNLIDLQFEVVEVQVLRSNGMLDATLRAKVRNPPVGAEASSKVQAALQQTVEGLGSDSNML